MLTAILQITAVKSHSLFLSVNFTGHQIYNLNMCAKFIPKKFILKLYITETNWILFVLCVNNHWEWIKII